MTGVAERRAFLLRELGGLSYGELGVALGVTQPAVESLLFRARQQLRETLAGANIAFIPVALRDQLARLIPGFGAAPAAALPIAAKVAAVTAGVGLVATGAVEPPRRDAVPAVRRSTQAQVVVPAEHRRSTPPVEQIAAPVRVHLVAQRVVEPKRRDGAEPVEAERDHAAAPAERQHDTEMPQASQVDGGDAPGDGQDHSNAGDGPDSSDGGD